MKLEPFGIEIYSTIDRYFGRGLSGGDPIIPIL
jgi:hypothetical protein